MYKNQTLFTFLVALFWFAFHSLAEDFGRRAIGDLGWLVMVCVVSSICFAALGYIWWREGVRAFQHQKGGLAKRELYTAGHEPVKGWRRIGVFLAPYFSSLAILAVVGLLGWSTIETLRAYGTLPISFRAGAFTRFPVTDNPLSNEAVVLQMVELVNHSKGNLSLEFRLLVRLRLPDGEKSGMMEEGEWRNGPFDNKTAQGARIVNLAGESTISGTLIFCFPDLDHWNVFKGQKWGDVGNDKFLLMITDKVSGKTILCSPTYYHAGLEKHFDDIE